MRTSGSANLERPERMDGMILPLQCETPAPTVVSLHGDWLLWQLVDSAFPTGGFAHSGGLESAWQHGEVRTRVELASFLEVALHQAGRNALPFVSTAHAHPECLAQWDRHCDAFITNHVANRASRAQGRAFLAAAQRVFLSASHEPQFEPILPPFGHLATVFGAVTRWLAVEGGTAGRIFLFNHLRGLLAGAVRLNIVGPMEAQALQFQMARQAEAIRERYAELTLDDLAQTSLLLEIWQGAQDRLYSRLFQS